MSVINDELNGQFYMELGAYRAVLLYAKRGDLLDLYHVYVPEPFRARGAAARLLVAAFDFAAVSGLKVVPTCPFIAADFLSRFPNYNSLVQAGSFVFAHGEE